MIYINARFLTQDMTGVQRFAAELCLQLARLRDDVIFLSPRDIKQVDIASRLNVKVVGSRSGHLWEQWDLPFFLRKNGCPLLVNLGNTAPLLYLNKVITLHDISYLRYPKTYSWGFRYCYKFFIPLLLGTCKKLLTVSGFSRDEICSQYGFSREKIHIIHNAVSEKFTVSHETGLRRGYFLAVSSHHYHKNFHGLLAAFNKLPEKYEMHMIVAGSTHPNYQPLEFDKNLGNKFSFVGRVSDEELVDLYRNAFCFLFPSLYEGFGLPPLEAQACGCPVIASNAAAMPEVLGESAILVDPLNDDALTEAMEKLVLDPKLRESLIAAGTENIERFSWLLSARQLSCVIDSV
ncbi:TPA: glycosyltransferase family 4 protein [Serratia marcescens]|nr:glycosyltransferase family 4 protein [Serratia marcescens]HAT2406648.1 glycosyltransferase family 4 protein [Serratia marcescens]HAT3099900.1 glycosyltransferase family 4 protein [Serratia marcescens]HAT3117156.1 glycosyltransferase family 4 protein [Serratia marcescens]HAT3128545.1 glycosyltransferase family 4 protein [Serratia marcescens]